MRNPELITADDLSSWPDNDARDAQENFPRLIRHLLCETPGVSAISVRVGNGVNVPGCDGVAYSDGTAPFLPTGSLVFEFGTNKEIGAKALDDYRKRVEESEAASHVFVFATPRRWGGKGKWLKERRSESKFGDVYVLDADDLEGWLEMSPFSHYWISEHLGKRPDDAQTLEYWWDTFHQATQPTLPLDMFTAGRESTKEHFQKMLNGAPQIITIQADWRDDCLAFIYASTAANPDSKLNAPEKAVIVVESNAAWKQIARRSGRLILVPKFDGADNHLARNNGHCVIQIVDRGRVALGNVDLELPRVSRPDVLKSLIDCGINFQKADHLAGLARRNMQSFVRALRRDAVVQTPIWATDTDAPMLATLTLVGAWDANNNKDRRAIAELVGSDYDTVESLCERRSGGNDRVMSRVCSAWRFASLEEAFRCLFSRIANRAIERWKRLVFTVLCKENSSCDLSPEKKFAQQVNPTASQVGYSEELKSGIALSLAMVGSIERRDTQLRKLRKIVADIVDQLLRRAVDDGTGSTWNLIAPRLPFLAEAAPRQFIDIVVESLEQETSSLMYTFNSDSSDLLFGDPFSYSHLLWALEVLAWSEEYFDDAIKCLTLLAVNRSGDKQGGNRPDKSLAAILCGWANCTTVSHDKRLTALDSVKQISSTVGWDLLFALWPDWTTMTPPTTPRFRADWCPLTDKPAQQEEQNAYFRGLVRRALAWSDVAPSNLKQLVEHINIGILPEDRAKIIDYLDQLSSSKEFVDDDRYLVWRTLRELATKHSHHRACWSLPKEEIKCLLALSDKWCPASPVLRHLYLFNHNPGLPDCALRHDNYDYVQKVEERRQDALSKILAAPQKLDDLEVLASRAEASSVLGQMLADLQELDFWDVVHWVNSSEDKLTVVVDAYLCRVLRQRGSSWLRGVLDDPRLTPSQRAAVLRRVPAKEDYWDVIARNRVDEDAYWRTAEMPVLPPNHMKDAIARLVACGRARDAIDSVVSSICSAKQDGVMTDLTADVLIDLLDVVCSEGFDQVSSQWHEIGKVLDHIVELKADQADVARLELLLYPLLGRHRESAVLHHVLATKADLFVELVKMVYGGKALCGLDCSVPSRSAESVVKGWCGCPGMTAGGELNATLMRRWVEIARQKLAAAELSDDGDYEIGRVLANSPEGANGAWPLPIVCELIDKIESKSLDRGFIVGMCRGLMSSVRGVYEGGRQERESAQRFLAWSKQIRSTSRHTAELLEEAAKVYEGRAMYEDEQAVMREDGL